MTVTDMDISSLRGTILPLDQRRRDALANFAMLSAVDAGRAPQAWVRKTWDLKDYEAKDLLKGNASEPVWERILKHPNGGWAVAIPIIGAVIGMGLDEFLANQRRKHVELARRSGAVARDLRAVPGLGRVGSDQYPADPTARTGSERG